MRTSSPPGNAHVGTDWKERRCAKFPCWRLQPPLQTCEGHSYDSYNYVFGRWSPVCNNVWWGAARSDCLLITCQRSVKFNMRPFTPGTCHVIHSLKCVKQITSVWHASCDMGMSLNRMVADLNVQCLLNSAVSRPSHYKSGITFKGQVNLILNPLQWNLHRLLVLLFIT